MAEARSTGSTASSMKTTTGNMVGVKLNTKGKGSNFTRIKNTSKKNIFLIPISCLRTATDFRSIGIVRSKLVEIIPAEKAKEVDSRLYDQNTTKPGFQIHIIFRAGDEVKIEDFLENFHGVEPGEHLFHHGDLYFNNLELKLLEGNAVQGAEKGKQKGTSKADEMIQDLQAIQDKFKDIELLLRRMKISLEAPQLIDQKKT